MDLGQKIEKLLKLTSMTKVELARKLGLKDSSVISHWVKNRFKPDRKNLQKLAAAFKKPVSYFEDDELPDNTFAEHVDTFTIREGTSTAKSFYELISSLPSAKHIGVALEIKSEFFDLPYTFEPEEFLPVMFDSKNKEAFRGLPTGFARFDKITNGLQNGDLIILAARPSVGKTAFALNIVNNIVRRKNEKKICDCTI